jgi:hypothetical protein
MSLIGAFSGQIGLPIKQNAVEPMGLFSPEQSTYEQDGHGLHQSRAEGLDCLPSLSPEAPRFPKEPEGADARPLRRRATKERPQPEREFRPLIPALAHVEQVRDPEATHSSAETPVAARSRLKLRARETRVPRRALEATAPAQGLLVSRGCHTA